MIKLANIVLYSLCASVLLLVACSRDPQYISGAHLLCDLDGHAYLVRDYYEPSNDGSFVHKTPDADRACAKLKG